MRLFILAIVAGIGVLVGIALYVGQGIINPGPPDKKIAMKGLTAERDTAGATDANMATLAESEALDAVATPEDEPSGKAYKSQLREASFPAGTTSFDSVALRKQLPEIFQFPEQTIQPAPPVADIQTQMKVMPVAKESDDASSSTSAVVADAPEAVSGGADCVRPDTPMVKHLTAPEHQPSVSTALNPNVHVEVSPPSEGRARSRMIVSR